MVTSFPPSNLVLANIRKEGSGFDPPMALGILGAYGGRNQKEIPDCRLGVLSLYGGIRVCEARTLKHVSLGCPPSADIGLTSTVLPGKLVTAASQESESVRDHISRPQEAHRVKLFPEELPHF